LEAFMSKIPDFIVIGAQKCGSSSIIENLDKHPDIFIPRTKDRINSRTLVYKEIHYFDKYYDRGIDWYKKLFTEGYRVCGEKTTNYFYFLHCHEKIAKTAPKVKLILTLRNPTDRFYSRYYSRLRMYGDLTPMEVIDRDLKRGTDQQFDDTLQQGYYIDQLEHLLNYFPLKQIYITYLEKTIRNQGKEYSQIWKYLKVAQRSKKARITHNRKTKIDYKKLKDDKVTERLNEIYHPYNERFFDFIGRENEWT